MSDELKIDNKKIRLIKGDITDIEVESFVFYASNDLVLGAGFGNAIAVRGGPAVQKELKEFGAIDTTQAVITAAGEMKVEYIIHAAGPKFQEAGLENKLRTTILNCLKRAEEKGIKQIAFPPMGCGLGRASLSLSKRSLY